MSRRTRYSKTNVTITSSGRIVGERPTSTRPHISYADVVEGRNGHSSRSSSHSQHDDRTEARSSTRNLRTAPNRTTLRYRGRNPRPAANDLRNNLRNNHALSTVSREEETYKVTIPMTDAYDTLYLMNLIKEHLDDSNIVFYNVSSASVSTEHFKECKTPTSSTWWAKTMRRRCATSAGASPPTPASGWSFSPPRRRCPCANLDDRVEEAIKVAMSSLYDSGSRVMNLANFRHAEEFKRQGLFVTIGKANVLRTVVQIIAENTPDLVALNLRENRMNFLEQLRPLSERCRSLRAIDLSKNRIHSFTEIGNLRDLDLVELVLEGNPFIDDFPSHAVYIKAVRKLFKNLKKLDNEDLPAEIGFDLGVVESLPETRGSCIPPAHSAFVYQFLEAYYKIYDTENRAGLIQAYHENATFSFSFSKHESTASTHDNMAGYRDSHNLLRLKDESYWVKFVKTSSVDIVAFLCKLPNTEHDPDSFKVDVPFCEGSLVTVVVTGTFRETFKTGKPGRSFVRTFYITPHGNGFAIINEMFVISNLSTKQVMEAKQQQKQQSSSSGSSSSSARRNVNNLDNLMIDVEFNRPSTSNALNSFGVGTSAPVVMPQLQPLQPQQQQQIQALPSLQPSLLPTATITSPPAGTLLAPGGQVLPAGIQAPAPATVVAAPAAAAAATTAAPDPAAPLTTEMELIVLKFMEVTKMNREYTLKCLQENGFNGDAAYAVFQKLQSLNIIPPEAFQK
ncbi:Nxf1p [Tyrophagus putrescentiae]|nr:Nxf1p [Tyrophagus putrescentiae]